MRTFPLLLAAGLLASACSAAADVDDPAVAASETSTTTLDTSPTAEPATGGAETATGIDLSEACTITTDGAPSGDVRLPFPAGWIVGECGFFDPDETILDEGQEPESVDIRWYVDPITFPTASELGDDDHSRFATTVSGLSAVRVAGTFPDDHPSTPGVGFTTWFVDLSAGQAGQEQVLVGSVVEGVGVDLDRSVPVLDLMARGLAAQNPYEDVDDDTHAIALRTSIAGAQATVTYDEGECLTLRSGGANGTVVSQACGLALLDDEAVRAIRLPWDDDIVVVAGFARADVTFVEALLDRDGDEFTYGAIPVNNDSGPAVFAVAPIDDDAVPSLRAVNRDGDVVSEFDGEDVES